MAFVRIKTIKGRKYAYLVENKWTKSGSRQKSKAYLGRVYSPIKTNLDHFEEYDESNKSKSEIIQDIVAMELKRHGFKTIKNNIWHSEDCVVNLDKWVVENKKGKKIAIAMNQGVLCNKTLEKLKNVKALDEIENKEGYALAKNIIETGLDVPKEIFIQFYQKLLR